VQNSRIKNLFVDPAFRRLEELIGRGEKKLRIGGLQQASKAFLLAHLFQRLAKPLVVISPTESEARTLYQDLAFFLGKEQIFLYPAWDVRATEMFTFQAETTLRRMEILGHLAGNKAAVFVLPLKALMQKVLPRSTFAAYLETVALGDLRDRDQLAEKLLSGGYSRVSLVEGKGEFAVRGSILDIFPLTAADPLRLEFLGDELESIRVFNTATQRSAEEICDFSLCPAGEIILSDKRRQLAVANIRRRANELGLSALLKNRLAEAVSNGSSASVNSLFLSLFYESADSYASSDDKPGRLYDYLPRDAWLVGDNSFALGQAEQEIEEEIDELLSKAEREESFYLGKTASYLVGADLFAPWKDYAQIHFDVPEQTGGGTPLATPDLGVKFSTERNVIARDAWKLHAHGDAGPLGFLVAHIKRHLEEGALVVFLCLGSEEAGRMAQLLLQHDLAVPRNFTAPAFWSALQEHQGRGKLIILDGQLSGGFHFPACKLVLMTEEELFGRKIARRKAKPPGEGYFLRSFGELNDGDHVVHTEHGIGLYRGLHKLTIDGLENDYLLLEYQQGDKLYIPVYRLDALQRYVGPADYLPTLDKLGSNAWEAVKEKVKKSVRVMAQELAAIYSARQALEGHSFSLPVGIYDEFCTGFEFEETPDQARAIADVEADLADPKPMDRLICGDAGFGKTEVAIRASFMAAMEGKQVAVLVPTTILAEQHFQTFSRRFRDWPVRVEVMNRFKSKAEQQKIVEGIRQGAVDIVIGTHRLVQKDIEFKDLGLMIIDEEQQFGVAHKEKLKKLRTMVDVLTLTATPIPRTLHMSMMGIRDLTVINTPPEDRLPTRSYLVEFDEDVIKEAIEGELARGGQVFFLHDRVRSMPAMVRLIKRIVPEVRIGVVHGQMKPQEIEEVMTGFVRRDYDVLVCTTIIGAGLDIPTANTIVINRADRFGLAQLYQIKGRVGRAKEEGRAYLMIPKGMMLSRDARRRLQAIMDFSEHGSGFRISYQDMEIRGGGNILGASQSGQMSAVGYELYTEIMEQTLREVKGQEPPLEVQKPEIHLGVAAFIPEEYMSDVRGRLIAYKRLSMAESDEELASIRDELCDCYGFIPSQLNNLLEVLSVKIILQRIRGKKMGYDKKNMVVTFRPDSNVDPDMILRLAREKWPALRLTPDLQLSIPMVDLQEEEILREAKGLLRLLSAGGREDPA